MTYARNQKKYLNTFLEHGEVDISNNLAENTIRPFVVGRKNWLFCDTPKGAESSAIVYTVVERECPQFCVTAKSSANRAKIWTRGRGLKPPPSPS